MDPKLDPHYTLAKFYRRCHSSKLMRQGNLTKQRRLLSIHNSLCHNCIELDVRSLAIASRASQFPSGALSCRVKV